jgi:hypothetical protein
MGYHLVAYLARLLLWLLGPISPTPHHILALDIPSPLQYFLLQLISCRSNLVPAMDQDEMEELYHRRYLMFCGNTTRILQQVAM